MTYIGSVSIGKISGNATVIFGHTVSISPTSSSKPTEDSNSDNTKTPTLDGLTQIQEILNSTGSGSLKHLKRLKCRLL